MTQAQHTQGKWTVTPLDGHQGYELKVDGFLPTVTNGEHEANARLIAAAPELLDALKEAIDVLEQFTSGIERHNEAEQWENSAVLIGRAAIAKAEGK